MASQSTKSPTAATPRPADALPPMPPPRRSSDPAIAALERAFADHLEDLGGSARRLRFTARDLWHYKCYCFGYPPASRSDRSNSEYSSARRNYTLRAEQDDDDDDDDNGGSGGGLGTLWSRASGPDKAPRRVVSTAGIVRTVMREHSALGHSALRETWARVVRGYSGILKGDVQWVVEHCPHCGDKTAEPSWPPPSSSARSPPALPGPVSRRASARLAAVGARRYKAADFSDEPSEDDSDEYGTDLDSDEDNTDSVSSSDIVMLAAKPAHFDSLQGEASPSHPNPESSKAAGSGGTSSLVEPPTASSSGPSPTNKAASINNDGDAKPVNALAVITFESTAVPFASIQLAVAKMPAAGGYGGKLHWLVCIFDTASAYSSLHAVERLHAADIAATVAHWVKSFSHAPATVRWPDACGGSPLLRRDLAVRLRVHGVLHVTAHAPTGRRDSDSVASFSSSLGRFFNDDDDDDDDDAPDAGAASSSDVRRQNNRGSGLSAPGTAGATSDDDSEISVQDIRGRVDSWMAAHDTNDWSKALVDVTLELNRRPLSGRHLWTGSKCLRTGAQCLRTGGPCTISSRYLASA